MPTPTIMNITEIDSQLHDDLSKLWALDRVPEHTTLSPDDQQAVDIFDSTTTLKDGRVQVKLPFKSNAPELGDSRKQAISRFYNNERSLSTKGKLDDFNAALREYLTLGHAHVIPPNELHPPRPVFYMPVHGVFKETSSITKVRPVFDASAKTTTGISLNDCLLVGPNLYPQLADVLIQFRQHPVGLSADISKMFREIRLDADHQDYHRFILREDNGRISDCRMERVTFGVASSPFLATQALRHIASKFKDRYPRAARLIETVFYVDDFVSGAVDTQDADNIRDELCGLLSEAGMTLRKWRSNSQIFLDHTPASLREVETTPLQLHDSAKALGAHWNTISDTLYVATPTAPSPDVKVTKRQVASISAAVFDMMGLFAPTTILPRLILQESWKLHLHWDKPLPGELLEPWNSWIQELHHIQERAIPRRFFDTSEPPIFLSMHGFSDASAKAYGAVIYLRAVTSDGTVQTALVTAKARVLPLKHVTIPRAELLAAHLLAKLLAHMSQVLDIDPHQLYAWIDSSITLHWLSKDPSQLKDRFVANRVQSCHDHLPSMMWRHVPTHQNPADLASRGVSASTLINSDLWWKGPLWLAEPPDKWPTYQLKSPPEAIHVLSIRPAMDLDTSQKEFLVSLWSRFSSLHVLTRVIARVYRFFNRVKNRHTYDTDILTSDELSTTQLTLICLSQKQDFPEVFSCISTDKPLPKNHPLHGFIPTFDGTVLRLLSRVRRPDSSTQPRSIIPLHNRSKFTRLLLTTAHHSHRHPGVSTLQNIISETYYVSGLRNLLKAISRACSSCQRAYARPLSQQLGLLPSVRTTPAHPFQKVGIDFAGPMLIRRGYTRKPLVEKCYVAVFVCMATKAVHLDVCTSLSSEDFLATLTRFVARRGCPSDVYSDNGSNFVGAREELRELKQLFRAQDTRRATSHFAQRNGITWHNIPPRAPHFGGLWEAAVRSMKTLLKKNCAPHPLRFDEIYTLLAEAESILNSRPLTEVLTAGHFLIGRPLRAFPEKDPPTANISTLRRWRLISKLKQDLWNAWLKAYLATQHQRQKWIKRNNNLRVGDLVFVKDEVLKVKEWPLARILEVFPGDDGQVRAVKLKCHNREYTRAVQQLIAFTPDNSPSLSRNSTSLSNLDSIDT